MGVTAPASRDTLVPGESSMFLTTHLLFSTLKCVYSEAYPSVKVMNACVFEQLLCQTELC